MFIRFLDPTYRRKGFYETASVSISIGSPPEMFLEKGPLIICSEFTAEHLCRSVISIEMSRLNIH